MLDGIIERMNGKQLILSFFTCFFFVALSYLLVRSLYFFHSLGFLFHPYHSWHFASDERNGGIAHLYFFIFSLYFAENQIMWPEYLKEIQRILQISHMMIQILFLFSFYLLLRIHSCNKVRVEY